MISLFPIFATEGCFILLFFFSIRRRNVKFEDGEVGDDDNQKRQMISECMIGSFHQKTWAPNLLAFGLL